MTTINWMSKNPLGAAKGVKRITQATNRLYQAVKHHTYAVEDEIQVLREEGLLRASDARKMERKLQSIRSLAIDIDQEGHLSVLSDEARLR